MNNQERIKLILEHAETAAKFKVGADNAVILERLQEIEAALGLSKEAIAAQAIDHYLKNYKKEK